MPRSLLLFMVLFVAGCHLVDQRDFNAQAGKPPALPVKAGPPPGPGALMTIDYGAGDPDYASALAQSVTRAITLKPGVLFTVQTLVPPLPTPAAEEAALREAAATAREIGEAIVANGADEGQIELAVRADPAVHAKEVRVFVH